MHKYPLPKFLVLLLIASQINSCFLFGDDYKRTYTAYSAWGGGIVTDSTALVLRYVYDFLEEVDGWQERYETRENSLIYVDIRAENIYWKKNIIPREDSRLSNLKLDVIDSVLFFFKTDGRDYQTTRIGYRISQITYKSLKDETLQQSKQVELKYKQIELVGEGWRSQLYVRVRPWQNGLILANSRGSENNNYALLDTVAGTMERWQPSGEYEWLNECMDVKWSSSIGGLCLKDIPDTLGFVLLKNGVDTLAVRYMPRELPVHHMTLDDTPLIFSGNSIFSKGWHYLMNEQGQVSDKPLDFWSPGIGIFYGIDGNSSVKYANKVVY